MRDDDLTIIGRSKRGGIVSSDEFGVTRRDRRQHLDVQGQTGTGKSTLLKRMLLQDIHRGEGVCLIDPLGVIADEIVDHIPTERINETCYWNVADLEWPIGFNILQGFPGEERHVTISRLLATFAGLWDLSPAKTPSIWNILSNGVAALVEHEHASLVWLQRFLTDDPWRKQFAHELKDESVRRFWLDVFEKRGEREKREQLTPVLNRLQELLRDPIMRNVLGSERKAINIPLHLAERRILIVNLAKAKVGRENARFLGAFLAAELAGAAAARIDAVTQALTQEAAEAERSGQPAECRVPDFYLYIDEFQDLAGAADFAEVLSQSRNGRLSLATFHQYQDQLGEDVRAAIAGNTGTRIAFRIGPEDAEYLERAFDGEHQAHELTRLERFEIAVKLPPAPGRGFPFRALTEPTTAARVGAREKIVSQTRMRFARPRQKVEAALKHIMPTTKERQLARLEAEMQKKPTPAQGTPPDRFREAIEKLRRKLDQ